MLAKYRCICCRNSTPMHMLQNMYMHIVAVYSLLMPSNSTVYNGTGVHKHLPWRHFQWAFSHTHCTMFTLYDYAILLALPQGKCISPKMVWPNSDQLCNLHNHLIMHSAVCYSQCARPHRLIAHTSSNCSSTNRAHQARCSWQMPLLSAGGLWCKYLIAGRLMSERWRGGMWPAFEYDRDEWN